MTTESATHLGSEEAFPQARYDFQRHSYGHLQAPRSYVKSYENLHGYKLRFETTWLDRRDRGLRTSRPRVHQ